jgi:hypothetical protein
VQVTATDTTGATVVGFVGNVTISLGANPDTATISGTTTVLATNGVATFDNLIISKAGSGFTLVASASGTRSGTSVVFDVL